MSEPENTPPNNNPPANDPPANNLPANNPPANTPPAQPQSQNVDLSGLMTALNALPETIAKSVKEAVGTPQSPAKPATESPKGESGKETSTGSAPGEIKKSEAQPGKGTGTAHERFLNWWNK